MEFFMKILLIIIILLLSIACSGNDNNSIESTPTPEKKTTSLRVVNYKPYPEKAENESSISLKQISSQELTADNFSLFAPRIYPTISTRYFDTEDKEVYSYQIDWKNSSILESGNIEAMVLEINIENDRFVTLDTFTTADTEALAADAVTTNEQEDGVSEADLIKSDGKYLYYASGNCLKIAEIAPSLKKAEYIYFQNNIEGIYTLTDKIIVIQRKSGNYYLCAIDGLQFASPYSTSNNKTFIDIINKNDVSFEKTSTIEIDGTHINSRVENDLLILATQCSTASEYYLQTYYQPGEDPAIIYQQNLDKIKFFAETNIILPKYSVSYNNVTIADNLVLSGNQIYSTEDGVGSSLLTVSTIDLSNEQPELNKVSFFGYGYELYAPSGKLYITNNTYPSTTIHRIDIIDRKPVYKASGKIPGRILNRWAMNEYNDVLRVAVINDQKDCSELYCLQLNNDKLEIIGSISNIAPRENLHSARFIGEKGYLVTFKKIDPLFTVDLSDHTNPKIVGELKVPGYSDYIHPFGDNYLLTLGKDTDNQGSFAWFQGIQLSIFDVSDMNNPRLLHKEIIGSRGTNSSALNNPQAFIFDEENSLLTLPIYLTEGSNGGSSYGTATFSGVYIYGVSSENGFDYKGRLGEDITNGYYYNYSNPGRGFFIGDRVYQVNENLIRTAEINNLDSYEVINWKNQ
jgi:inhibitor of cysteine peptidase